MPSWLRGSVRRWEDMNFAILRRAYGEAQPQEERDVRPLVCNDGHWHRKRSSRASGIEHIHGGDGQRVERHHTLPPSLRFHERPHHAREVNYLHGNPLPALDLITAVASDVMVKANNISRNLLDATMDVVMIFPSLVLYPHEKGACNSQVRAEGNRLLTLWGAGDLESLATLARASRAARPFTSGTSVRPSSTQRASSTRANSLGQRCLRTRLAWL
jgi:hypothetical protein